MGRCHVGMELQVGSRLRSAVCAAEVVVVKAPSGAVDLCCGGAPMVLGGEVADQGLPQEGLDTGTLLGKRYTDGVDLELLCSKAGEGTLSVGSEPLEIKGAKPLPSSD
jgi:hypothetical protein